MLGFTALLLTLSSNANSAESPNHLQPVVPYNHGGDNYYRIVFNTLIKDVLPEAWMLVRPSFRPEYAVILRKASANDTNITEYALEYAVVEKPIWNWKDVGGGQYALDLQDDVKVERQTVRFPETEAEELISVWQAVVKQTKYADKVWVGRDGVSYDFYVQPALFGGTWSPESGAPLLMVNCGELLIQYVMVGDAVREEVLKQVVELSAKLRVEAK